MVTKEKIETIINMVSSQYTEKCNKVIDGETSSLNNKVRGRLNKFFDETNQLTYERVLYLDNEGNDLLTKNGDEHSWKVSGEELTNMVLDNIEYFRTHEGHITHNHPHTYNGAEDGNMEFTCLSQADVNNLKNKWTDTDGTRRYLTQSITADCGNGTRMTLIRKTDDFNNETLDKLYKKLDTNWTKYIQDSQAYTSEKLGEYALKYGETHNGKLPPVEDLKKIKQKSQKEYSKKFKKYIEPNIKEFHENGFELSYEYLRK